MRTTRAATERLIADTIIWNGLVRFARSRAAVFVLVVMRRGFGLTLCWMLFTEMRTGRQRNDEAVSLYNRKLWLADEPRLVNGMKVD